jgi:hypothetical protein
VVVIQEHKTFCELWVTLTPWCGGSGTYGTFRHITYVNINGVKLKWKKAPYFKFLYIAYGVLLVRYRRNRRRQFVGELIAK